MFALLKLVKDSAEVSISLTHQLLGSLDEGVKCKGADTESAGQCDALDAVKVARVLGVWYFVHRRNFESLEEVRRRNHRTLADVDVFGDPVKRHDAVVLVGDVRQLLALERVVPEHFQRDVVRDLQALESFRLGGQLHQLDGERVEIFLRRLPIALV